MIQYRLHELAYGVKIKREKQILEHMHTNKDI